MYPELFQVGPYPVYSYGFLILLGILAAFFYMNSQKHQLDLTIPDLIQFFLISLVCAVIGGKVFLWMANPEYYSKHLYELKSWSGRGFVFYGSLMFCFLGWWYFAKIKGIHFLLFLDAVVVGGVMLQILGKAGCFLAGCCYGKVCDGFPGVIYHDPGSAARPLNQGLYPVQLIDVFLLLLILVLLLYLKKKKSFNGRVMLTYLITYSVSRFLTELMRGDEERGFLFNHLLSQSQFVSLLILIIAITSYLVHLRRYKTSGREQ